MIGSRSGSKASLYGSKVGSTTDDESGVATMTGVTKDATSNIYYPANAAEWIQTLAYASILTSGPDRVWLCNDAAAPLAAAIGTDTLALTGTAPTYQSAVAGWAKAGVLMADAATTKFATAAAGLPSINTTSMLVLGYVSMPAAAPAASRQIVVLGSTATGAEIRINSTPKLQVLGGGSTLSASNPTGAVRPVVLKVDRTATAAVVAYTDQDKFQTTLGAITGKLFDIGNGAVSAPAATHLYWAQFAGANAELTDAQIKTLLQALGWTIAW